MILPQQLRAQLQSEFDLVCFEDLGTVVKKHSTIYKLFKSLRQDSFLNHQRLIFYTSSRPTGKILSHIQRAASRIDISNWFIKIYCPHDVQHELNAANKQYGYDDQSIEWVSCDLTQTEPLKDSSIASYETMCPAPFGHLDVWHNATAKPCCRYQGTLGDFDLTNAKEVFHGSKFAELRQQLIDGQRPVGCDSCWHSEKHGTQSYRQLFMYKYGDALNSDWIDNPLIREVSVNPNITCNFKCRICNEFTSSSISVEEIKFQDNVEIKSKIKEILKIRTNTDRMDKIINYFRDLYNDLEYFHVVGGEPFLVPKFDNLLQSMIDSGHAEHIGLGLNTNGSQFDLSIIELLKQFHYVEILLSIDDIGPRFEIQRGSNWSLIDSNIKNFLKISQESKNFKVQISPTVNVQNILYLNDLIEYARQNDLDILWTYLDGPAYMNIDYLTPAAKKLVWEKYHNSDNVELVKIAERVRDSVGSDGKTFIEETKKFDFRRKQNFAKHHSEIYQAMSIPDGGCSIDEKNSSYFQFKF